VNQIRRLLKSLFPAPRTPVRATEWAGILLAIVAYLVAAWLMEKYHVMQFLRPWAFALSSLALWVWWMHRNGFHGLPLGGGDKRFAGWLFGIAAIPFSIAALAVWAPTLPTFLRWLIPIAIGGTAIAVTNARQFEYRNWVGWLAVIAFGLSASTVFTVQMLRQSDAVSHWTCFALGATFFLIAASMFLGRANSALAVRLCLLGLFVALLAEPRSVRSTDRLSVVFALDSSDSIGRTASERGAEFIAKVVNEKPDKDEAGLVTFAANAAVELPPRQAFPLEGGSIILNSRISPDATNIEQSLSLAAAMLPEDTRGRIVLISDGAQTGSTGDLSQVINNLKGRGIAVDVLPIEYSYDKEVWIERLELPQRVQLNERYEASVVVSSLKPGKGRLKLTENGQLIADAPIEYKQGKNRYDLPMELKTPGYLEYQATIEPEKGEDNLVQNNRADGYLYIEGKGKVLLVTDPSGTDEEWKALRDSLRRAEREVEVTPALNVPRDALSLLPYDCIILCNVERFSLDESQMQAMHDAVFNEGTGLMMVGGNRSFGPGGYHKTVIEDALPVSMDVTNKKVLPKGALAIILHTCEFPEGNTWAKRITKEAIKVLSARDEIGVIDYEGGEQWVIKLGEVGEYEQMATKINAAEPGDMPAFAPTMELGLKSLIDSDAASKHMIIISDGDPVPPPGDLLKKFATEQITISTVSIFPHGGQEVAIMRSIADLTGGRYYFPDDPNKLPTIFFKEARTLKRNLLFKGDVVVKLGEYGPQSAVIRGIESIPHLDGYVLTSLKESGLPEEILMTQPEGDGNITDPILAVWRYGLGSTAAYTADFSSFLGKNWVNWEKFDAFTKQLMIRISRAAKKGHLRMWAYSTGAEGVVMAEDFHEDEMFLDVAAQVSGPNDRREMVSLKQVAPRRYQATFPQWGAGRYQVTLLGKAGEREDRTTGGFIVSYSPEYLKFTSNWNILRQIQEETGGTLLTDSGKGKENAEQIFNRRERKTTSQPVFDWFLIALCFLVPLDVGIRRIQLDWAAILRSLGFGKATAPTATMGTLLAKKQEVSSQLKGQRPTPSPGGSPQPAPSFLNKTGPAPERKAAPTPTPRPSSTPAAKQPVEDTSTTSRLLDLKRKRAQDGEKKG
jgi:uncharacterized membrane protein